MTKNKATKNSENKIPTNIPHKSTTITPVNLDEINRKMLDILQDDFPLVQQPWLEISKKLNVSESEVIKRISTLSQAGVIRKVGPTIDATKLGLNATTLVAMRVPKDRVEQVAQIINQQNNVSHNYEREDEYNVWFTLTAVDDQELTKQLNEIIQRSGISDQEVLNLPTVYRFKINVRFQLAQTNCLEEKVHG